RAVCKAGGAAARAVKGCARSSVRRWRALGRARRSGGVRAAFGRRSGGGMRRAENIRVPHPAAVARSIGSGQRALAQVAREARLPAGGEFAVAIGDERAERGWIGADGVAEAAADAKAAAVG